MNRLIVAALSVAWLVACGPPPGRPSTAEEPARQTGRAGTRGAEDTEGRVGVVSLERVLRETEQGRRASERLEEEGQAVQRQLAELQVRLETLGEELQSAQSGGAAEAQLRQLAGEYQDLAMEAQQTQATLQAQLQERRQTLTEPIYAAVRRHAGRIGERDGFALILEQQSAPFADPDSDLTDRIITLLEEETAQRAIEEELAEGEASENSSPEE